VPPALRGKYLVRDAAVQNISSFVTFLVSAAVLAGNAQSWQFASLFAFSAVMGAVILVFLKRIPDVPTPEEPGVSTFRVPWVEMTRYAPFRKLLRTVVAWSVAYGGISAFTVAYLKSAAGMSEGKILLVSSAAFLGGLGSLWFLGVHLDRFGSKPVLGFSFAAWMAALAGWATLAGGILLPQLVTVLFLQCLMGLLGPIDIQLSHRIAQAR